MRDKKKKVAWDNEMRKNRKKKWVRKWDVNEKKMVKVGRDRSKRVGWDSSKKRKGMTNVVKVIFQVNKLNDI